VVGQRPTAVWRRAVVDGMGALAGIYLGVGGDAGRHRADWQIVRIVGVAAVTDGSAMMASMMAVGTQVALGGMWRAGESRVKRSAAAQAPPPPQTADGRRAYVSRIDYMIACRHATYDSILLMRAKHRPSMPRCPCPCKISCTYSSSQIRRHTIVHASTCCPRLRGLFEETKHNYSISPLATLTQLAPT